MAAEKGDADAQLYLGVEYFDGEGVPEDDVEAVRWFRMAAEQGPCSSAKQPRGHVRDVEGILADPVLAHMWYNIAGLTDRTGPKNTGNVWSQG